MTRNHITSQIFFVTPHPLILLAADDTFIQKFSLGHTRKKATPKEGDGGEIWRDVTSQNGSRGSESLGDQERDQTMKGKRHTTVEKIRALREADGGKPIREVCQERNISEADGAAFPGEPGFDFAKCRIGRGGHRA